MIRHVIKANSILLIQYAVGSLVPLLLVPHIVNVIGLAEYGQIAVLIAWGSYAATIVQYSFHLTGPKRIMQLKPGETTTTVFFDITSAKISLLFFVIIVLFLSIILFENKSKSAYSWLILIAMPVAAGFNSIWFLQSRDKFSTICLLSIISSLITLIIGFIFINKGNDKAIDVAVLMSFFGVIFIGFSTFFMGAKLANFKDYKVRLISVKNSLKDGWHLFISQFISTLYTASGPIFIIYFINSEAAGAYSVTERAISALMAAALLTHTAAYPRLAAAYVNDRAAYWRTIKFIIIGYVSITLIFSLIILNRKVFVLNFLYGKSAADHSSLLFFGLLWFISGIFGVVLTGYLTVSNKNKEIWPLNFKILVTSLLLGVLGLTYFGAAGWLAAIVAAQSINIYYGYKYWLLNYRQ